MQSASLPSPGWSLGDMQKCLPLKICLHYLLMHFNQSAVLVWEL